MTVLGLDPTSREFRVVYGAVAANDKEIAHPESVDPARSSLTSSSVINGAQGARDGAPGGNRQPEADTGFGRKDAALDPDRRAPPGPARVTPLLPLPYRGHWFSIDDRDMLSKHVFSFLMFLFTFVETESKEATPILTIPTQ